MEFAHHLEMLLIPKIIQAKLNRYGTCNAEKQKKTTTSPLFTAVRQTRCFAHAFSLYTILVLPSTVAEETKAELF